ncbi:hypothetical protein AYJ57_10335 [Salipiger sp. CCB-MM3]|uniref:hypothetical protein n=1 Tax=Salipiger sp. CCB-MM3 TaxID=1792508 RepID=UPI00080AA4EC|nr:hypothetical protein [Salipiger sp. CCB-MM3]ANT60727.1 hypothetical protein AYJ57_10335 [Salipiger sp. CCB-MM3]
MTATTATPRTPSRLRFAIFVFIAVYPLVTLLLYLIGPITAEWQVWQRNLLFVPIMVFSMVWVIIPRIQRHCGRWL